MIGRTVYVKRKSTETYEQNRVIDIRIPAVVEKQLSSADWDVIPERCSVGIDLALLHLSNANTATTNPSANRADLCLPSVCNKHALLLVNVGSDEDGTVQRALSIDSLNPLADAHDTLLVTDLLRVSANCRRPRAHIVDGGRWTRSESLNTVSSALMMLHISLTSFCPTSTRT